MVVVLIGGITFWLPSCEVRIFPGVIIPVSALTRFHESSVPEPLVTEEGVLVSVQLGTGGGDTAVVVTDALHDPVPARFEVVRVY